jgi:uncharacterized protein
MRKIQIKSLENPACTPVQAAIADTFIERFLGLMFRKELISSDGLLLAGHRDSRAESAIHMFFMRFDIAVIWINSNMHVVDIQHAKKWHPWYIPIKSAQFILETHLGNLCLYKIGERVQFLYE